MGAALVADALIDRAIKATGLDRFDSDSYREGLDILLADANQAGLSDSGHARMEANVVDLLSNRLRTTDYLAQRPELLERPVERPVFVFGIPRTGTTLLSNLLACDPARRSPLTWEIDEPVPPATSATLKSDPRAIARLEQEKAMLAAGRKWANIIAIRPSTPMNASSSWRMISRRWRWNRGGSCPIIATGSSPPT